MKPTLRFCESCKAVTLWKLDYAVGHSRCEECGCNFCRLPKPTDRDYKKMVNSHRNLQLAGKFRREIRDDFAIGCSLITHDIDDELDKVNA